MLTLPRVWKPCRGKSYKIPLEFFFNLHSSGTQPCQKLGRENVIPSHLNRGLVVFGYRGIFGIILTQECFRNYIPPQTFCLNISRGFFTKLTPQRVNARNLPMRQSKIFPPAGYAFVQNSRGKISCILSNGFWLFDPQSFLFNNQHSGEVLKYIPWEDSLLHASRWCFWGIGARECNCSNYLILMLQKVPRRGYLFRSPLWSRVSRFCTFKVQSCTWSAKQGKWIFPSVRFRAYEYLVWRDAWVRQFHPASACSHLHTQGASGAYWRDPSRFDARGDIAIYLLYTRYPPQHACRKSGWCCVVRLSGRIYEKW